MISAAVETLSKTRVHRKLAITGGETTGHKCSPQNCGFSEFWETNKTIATAMVIRRGQTFLIIRIPQKDFPPPTHTDTHTQRMKKKRKKRNGQRHTTCISENAKS